MRLLRRSRGHKMASARLNKQRRENYQFYRSIGYSSKQAANLRNKTPKSMIREYRSARSDYNEARYKYYRKETKKPDVPKPHRPEIEVIQSELDEYRFKFYTDYNIPGHIIDQMTADNSFFDLEIYSDRLAGLERHFNENHPEYTWEDLMDMLSEIEDLGDWFDIIGEFYDEED